MKIRRLLLTAVGYFICAMTLPCWAADTISPDAAPVRVAVASSMRNLWPALTAAYAQEQQSGLPKASFASSGLLSTQIRQGAPFDIFISADPHYIDALAHHQAEALQTATLATGTISLAMLADSSLANQRSAASLVSQIQTLNQVRLAMPNDRHAPYGFAARQWLDSQSLWPWPREQLLAAENAAQALQFLLSGAVDLALLPDTLLVQTPRPLTTLTLNDKDYEPVLHQAVLLNRSNTPATAFFDWLQSNSAKAVYAAYHLLPVAASTRQ